jgi:hypothetical protein
MSTPTTNLSLNKPAVGGDDDVWGSLTNDNWDTLDTLIFSIQQAILPIGGILLWSRLAASCCGPEPSPPYRRDLVYVTAAAIPDLTATAPCLHRISGLSL